MASDGTAVTFLGLGAMGNALATAVLDAGTPTTVWNRTAGRDTGLVARGAASAPSIRAAVTASPVIIVCLLDHASVHETLDPVADALASRTLINLTTTTPNQARELAAWAAEHSIDYLDGGIMAVPAMIGKPGAAILYSGSHEAYESQRALLSRWGESSYHGADAGMASLYDLAMLSGMYVMFAGFLHGAAMVGSEGVSADEFATKAVPFLGAMVGEMRGFAEVVDGGDYAVPGQQSLEFSDLTDLIRASDEQGVDSAPIAIVRSLIRRQVDAGHGADGFARIYESLRHPETSSPKITIEERTA